MPKDHLKREVAVAFTLKIVVVVAAALFVFGPGQRPRIDAEIVAMRLIGPAGVSPETQESLR